jgi:hypothetical protein
VNDKDKIAGQYGFDNYAELLGISDPLPKQAGDKAQSYVARKADGMWFVWEDAPPPVAPPPDVPVAKSN